VQATAAPATREIVTGYALGLSKLIVAEPASQQARSHPHPLEAPSKTAMAFATAERLRTLAESVAGIISAVLTDLKTLTTPAVTTPRRVATAFALAESQ